MTETEAQFSSWLEDSLTLFKWKWVHSRPAFDRGGWRTAMSGDKGYPDYVAVKDGRLLFLEAKSERGSVMPEQREWLAALGAVAGVTARLVKPSQRAEILGLLE